MRMSSGPSKRKLKPRSGVSICGEDTPMSSITPSARSTPSAASTSAMAPKLAWWMEKRGSAMACSPEVAAASASGSRSSAMSRPRGPSRCSSRRECPPRPNVPST
jgi:hypothetical protein